MGSILDYHRDDYWKIYFEVFSNGNKIGSGVWTQCYQHKSSAVSRAKKQFGEPRESPLTGETLTYKWIVSKNNPWEEEE